MMMIQSQFPQHIQELLIKKRDDWIRQMSVDKFTTVEIGFVFNLTKSRISQIVNEVKSK
jgi:hypothetical protein